MATTKKKEEETKQPPSKSKISTTWIYVIVLVAAAALILYLGFLRKGRKDSNADRFLNAKVEKAIRKAQGRKGFSKAQVTQRRLDGLNLGRSKARTTDGQPSDAGRSMSLDGQSSLHTNPEELATRP